MGRQKNLKSVFFVTSEKTKEGLRIFADVMMDIQKGGRCWFEFGQSARRDRHEISHTADFDQRCSFAVALENCSA